MVVQSSVGSSTRVWKFLHTRPFPFGTTRPTPPLAVAAACSRRGDSVAAMAMEIRRVISGPADTPAHDGQILCIAYNPHRREISTGSQDTTVKTWLSETGEHVRTLQEHKGWVTGLAFSPELRVLFSCSIDGRVLVWSKAELLQKEKVESGKGGSSDVAGAGVVKGGPLHCLAWDARRHSLVVGANGHIWVYAAIPETEMSPTTKTIIRLQSLLKDAHAGMGPENALVRGIISTVSGKLFSVGYDRQLRMWDTDSTRTINLNATKKTNRKSATGGPGASFADARDAPKLKPVGEPLVCHEGAISAVTFDPDNNWIITGSFDRQVSEQRARARACAPAESATAEAARASCARRRAACAATRGAVCGACSAVCGACSAV